MDSVAIRVFTFSVLPVIIAVGHLGLDRSSRPRERRLEIFLLYLFGVGVAGSGIVGLCQVGARGRAIWRSHRGAGRWHTGQAPAQQASRTCSSPSSCHTLRPTPPVLGVAVAPR
jgi:hypothetical protein